MTAVSIAAKVLSKRVTTVFNRQATCLDLYFIRFYGMIGGVGQQKKYQDVESKRYKVYSDVLSISPVSSMDGGIVSATLSSCAFNQRIWSVVCDQVV